MYLKKPVVIKNFRISKFKLSQKQIHMKPLRLWSKGFFLIVKLLNVLPVSRKACSNQQDVLFIAVPSIIIKPKERIFKGAINQAPRNQRQNLFSVRHQCGKIKSLGRLVSYHLQLETLLGAFCCPVPQTFLLVTIIVQPKPLSYNRYTFYLNPTISRNLCLYF